MKFRIENDTMGNVKVPNDKYWGAQTQRSIDNFKIGLPSSMPIEIIYAYAYIKKAAAIVNYEFGILDEKRKNLISAVCDEILEGKHDLQFPLVIWQTGSGTQTNMNINEVISNRAHVLDGNILGKGTKLIHPNDHVNKSQSSNDTFPTAINIALYKIINETTIPCLKLLKKSFFSKEIEFDKIIKIGRTHLMDATPISLGQEFSGYVSQLEHGIKALSNTIPHLSELAVGGTAVGTSINAPKNFDKKVVKLISDFTDLKFISAKNKFEAIASNDAIVETHGALKQLAVSLFKIANDIRLMGSGPRSGIAELILPANEPGSSIMPGKVNPTQCEALTMVCAQVIGNDTSISFSGSQGHFELNVFKPLIAAKSIESAKLIGNASESFNKNCVQGLKPNTKKIKTLLNNSLMLVTALNNKIGYYKACEIAQIAHNEDISLKEAALKTGHLSEKEYELWVDPKKMVGF